MKAILVLLLVFTGFNSMSGGGPEVHSRFFIHCFEPNLNLEYISMYDTIVYLDDKGKEKSRSITSNVAIYNATKDSVNYIFKDNIKRKIIHFYFEADYVSQYKTIAFNDNSQHTRYDEISSFEFSNNRNVEKRPLANSLLIFTEDIKSGDITIWKTDKYGNNLKKLFEIDDSWNWEIDVKNQKVRIFRQVLNRMEFKNESY